jgi:hypothetical protein
MHINIHLIEMVERMLAGKEGKPRLKDYEKTKLRGIERQAEQGELKTAEVIAGLERIDSLDDNFDKKDFRELEKEIEKKLKS